MKAERKNRKKIKDHKEKGTINQMINKINKERKINLL